MNSITPDISIIVPLLNEAAELPELLESLAAQRGVTLELILCDGGSSDGSQKIASTFANEYSFPVKLIQTGPGRGRQMNAGVAAASADLLLFLHADSRFDDSSALLEAVNFSCSNSTTGGEEFAARFGLRFRRSDSARALSYFFYEAKARLPRRDCLRGDQGFLLSRKTFERAGRFDQSLPFLEDLRLVAATPPQLHWQLLPASVSTSARRFEREGLLERQILNAIIVNNVEAGWSMFFESLPGLYRSQCHDSTGKLLLFPILDGINTLLKKESAGWQLSFWRSTGQHVAANAWQLFYWLDASRAFRSGKGPEQVQPFWLQLYQTRLEWIFHSLPAAAVARLAVKLWLRWMLFRGTRQTA